MELQKSGALCCVSSQINSYEGKETTIDSRQRPQMSRRRLRSSSSSSSIKHLESKLKGRDPRYRQQPNRIAGCWVGLTPTAPHHFPPFSSHSGICSLLRPTTGKQTAACSLVSQPTIRRFLIKSCQQWEKQGEKRRRRRKRRMNTPCVFLCVCASHSAPRAY